MGERTKFVRENAKKHGIIGEKMTETERKFYQNSSKSWLSAVRSMETRGKKQLLPSNGNLYHYGANNPVRYIDPTGRAVAHVFPFGWGHHAPQRIFGYFSFYDFLSMFIGFAIDGTRINGSDFTIRVWKGNYGLFGAGCEIGIYSKNGKSLNRNELKKLGLESTSAILKDENGKVLGVQEEKKPSFWTTIFKPFRFKRRKNINAEFTLTFSDEDTARNIYDQIGGVDKEKDYGNYYWSGENNTHIELKGRNIVINYNSKEFEDEK